MYGINKLVEKEKKHRHYINCNKHLVCLFSSTSVKMTSSFLRLPVELVYRIINNMNDGTMVCSMQNVCTRLNPILNSYYRYKVRYRFMSMFHFHYLRSIYHILKHFLYTQRVITLSSRS